jgi:hypothetical protein
LEKNTNKDLTTFINDVLGELKKEFKLWSFYYLSYQSCSLKFII